MQRAADPDHASKQAAGAGPGRWRLAPGTLPCYHRYVKLRRELRRDRLAVLAGLAVPLVLTSILIPFRTSFANTDAALALLLVVVAVAANGYRLAGDLAALSAAVWFDFFLTRPYERFTISRPTDIETTVLLLVIGVAVTELAVWGRRQHVTASRRAGYLDGINAAAGAVAVGGSSAALIAQVSDALSQLLSLRSCQFQYGVAGLGRPARLQHDGQVVAVNRTWNVEREGLPGDTGIELLVENGGVLQGRYLMMPYPSSRPTLEQRLVAVAFADQVGAALAAGHPISN
jgi:K+-sensing histidine kinase KdpD